MLAMVIVAIAVATSVSNAKSDRFTVAPAPPPLPVNSKDSTFRVPPVIKLFVSVPPPATVAQEYVPAPSVIKTSPFVAPESSGKENISVSRAKGERSTVAPAPPVPVSSRLSTLRTPADIKSLPSAAPPKIGVRSTPVPPEILRVFPAKLKPCSSVFARGAKLTVLLNPPLAPVKFKLVPTNCTLDTTPSLPPPKAEISTFPLNPPLAPVKLRLTPSNPTLEMTPSAPPPAIRPSMSVCNSSKAN